MEDGTKSDTKLSSPVHSTVTYTRGGWPPDWPQGRHREGQGQSVSNASDVRHFTRSSVQINFLTS